MTDDGSSTFGAEHASGESPDAASSAGSDAAAYLAALGDALRPLSDPLAIQEAATRLVCWRLEADGAGYSVVTDDGEHFITLAGHDLGVLESGEPFFVADFGRPVLEAMQAGRTLVVPDVQASPLFSPSELAAYRAADVRAFINLPLVKDGRCVATFGVRHSRPRDWTAQDVDLVEDTAERTWAAVERARVERALAASQADARLSEGKYRLLHDAMREAFVQVDMEGRIIDCNDAFMELVGHTSGELRTLTYRDLTPERWHAFEDDIVREEILPAGYSHVYEKEYRRKDGSVVPVELRTILIRDDEGRAQAMWALVRDISERRQAEEMLRALQERQEFLLEVSDALRSLRDPLEIQSAASRLLGEHLGADSVGYAEPQEDRTMAVRCTYARGVTSLEGLLGRPESSPALLAELEAGRTVAHADTAAGRPAPASEKHAAAGQGSGAVLNVPLLKEGALVGVLFAHFFAAHAWSAAEVSLAEDVAERTWAAVAAARAEARLREQIEQRAAELERARLARDLHDSVTQSLFAASLKAESLAESPDASPRMREGLGELRRLAVGAMAGMRTMLLELRAGALEQTPLVGLLRHVVEEAGTRTGVTIALEVNGERQLPPEVRVAAYRVAQEAVTNAIRHAQATSLRVILRLSPSGLRLRIEDDGSGFEHGLRDGHVGLAAMRERADAVGAACTVESAPGSGTVVEFVWREGMPGRE